MELRSILEGIEGIKAKGNIDIDIRNVENDSRKINEGTLFVAIKGFEVDGHNYINTAIEKGASAVMVEEGYDLKKINLKEGVTILVAPNTRKALAICSCNFFENPSRKFKLIGITGTKGKTTTSFMLKEILEKEGLKVGLIGTIATYLGKHKLKDNERTTPGSVELQKIFKFMEQEKAQVVIMEVSSQSLKLDRIAGSDFDIGVFTNFSEDHISEKEHPNLEDYFNSKLKLFELCKFGFVNGDDLYGIKVKKLAKNCDIKTYGIDNSADLLARDISISNTNSNFRVKLNGKGERISTSIPGRFSVYNCLAAISVALNLGVKSEKIIQAISEVKVPGRSELIQNKKNLSIMIDYAHSPESLESILKAVGNYCKGKLICVFGCGGNRDKVKRPKMGEISGKIADFTIITTDNPRYEKPKEIINEIEDGIKKTNGKYICIEDRIEAIKYAIEMCEKNDIIILAGKGHEPYQEINGEKFSFDERKIVNDIIDNLKK